MHQQVWKILNNCANNIYLSVLHHPKFTNWSADINKSIIVYQIKASYDILASVSEGLHICTCTSKRVEWCSRTDVGQITIDFQIWSNMSMYYITICNRFRCMTIIADHIAEHWAPQLACGPAFLSIGCQWLPGYRDLPSQGPSLCWAGCGPSNRGIAKLLESIATDSHTHHVLSLIEQSLSAGTMAFLVSRAQAKASSCCKLWE